MAIPALQENGGLPPGLYLASLDEIREKFGRTSQRRRVLFQRLQTFVALARHVGALRMFVNGSYVTAKTDPGDVDVVIWVGEKFLQLLEEGDDQALDLESMFSLREPEQAFAAFDEEEWEDSRADQIELGVSLVVGETDIFDRHRGDRPRAVEPVVALHADHRDDADPQPRERAHNYLERPDDVDPGEDAGERERAKKLHELTLAAEGHGGRVGPHVEDAELRRRQVRRREHEVVRGDATRARGRDLRRARPHDGYESCRRHGCPGAPWHVCSLVPLEP
ncbi:hypothetical protein IH992_29575 [Candidatus Poribacteria bacterium]|nr:hypothetical protein [Candidatus Poribacteria bacterium]